MNLSEWTSAFIDYLNSFKRDMTKKFAEGNIITCEHEGKGIVEYIVMERLENSVLERLGDKAVLVTLNTGENLKFMIENWPKLSSNTTLKVIFANPKINMQWSIMPHLHHKFADPASLKTGLKSLFSSVPEV
ncbi:TPA: hypothetical protein HA239_03055 [Candidatus Woesearchaeota archaeon]|nr:hypothetical protein QT06_C0001G0685 [archaeon GW2011_AR15]MBS3103528.1 hypothetical protein [Candidatus Woesearchaeota archaeon]HIH41368.1 hypothetical protein [Candidatus Woesearchaeota archaeon]